MSEAESICRLRLLGPVVVEREGMLVRGFQSRKALALLGYLAVQEHPVPREQLVDLLWTEQPEARGRANLSWVLHRISALLPGCLEAERHTIQRHQGSAYWVDTDAFKELEAQGEITSLAAAADLYRGQFLEGLYVDGCPEFEVWLVGERERWRQRAGRVLAELVTLHSQLREYQEALRFARRQLALDAWREEAHRQVMRLLAWDGQRGAALTQYESCSRVLARELGVEPAPETTRLYEQIRDGTLEFPAPPTYHPSDLAGQPLPFLDEATPFQMPVFVGREPELARLNGFLDEALAGRGSVVFVTGGPGRGKTALIQEFSRRAQAAHPDLIVVGGNCNAYSGIGDPYLPFREVLGLLTGDVEGRWRAGAIAKDHALRLWCTVPLAVQVLADVGPDLIDVFLSGVGLVKRARAFAEWSGGTGWLPRVQELVERTIHRQANGPAITLGEPWRLQSALFEQYARVLEELARQAPLLLAFDDLQWADRGSASLLLHVGRRIPSSRVLLVGAYRPADVTPEYSAFPSPAEPILRRPPSVSGREAQEGTGSDRGRHPLKLVLNELKRRFGEIDIDLGRTEDRDFIDAFLETEPNRLSAAFRQTLFRQTRGHPLFTIELLRGMQERGDLVHDGEGQWVEGPALDWETLPARVEAVIAERVDRLPKRLRNTLVVASVEGETFTAEAVADALSVDKQQMVEVLSRELDGRYRLVTARGSQLLDGQRLSLYRFRHALFQRYLYNNLDPVERAHLHQAVGNALEALYREDTREAAAITPQLARHFQESGDTEKAARYLVQAGDLALGMYAHQEALIHYRQAKVAHEQAFGERREPVRWAVLERKMGEALFQGGEHQQAMDHLQRALAYLGKPLPTSRWGTRLAIIGQLLRQAAHRFFPSLLVKPVGQLINPAVEAEVRVYETMAWIAGLTDSERFVSLSIKQLNVSERGGFGYGIVSGSVVLGFTIDLVPVHWLADWYLRRALVLAEQTQHPDALRMAHFGMTAHKTFVGEHDSAIAYAQQAADICQRTGDLHTWGVVIRLVVDSLGYQGKLAEALLRSQDIVNVGQTGADPQVRSWGFTAQGRSHRDLGQLEEAIAALQQAIELAIAVPDHAIHIEAGGNLGVCHSRLGQLEKALSVLNATRQIYVKHGTGWGTNIALFNGLAEVYLAAAEQADETDKAYSLSRAARACQEALKTSKTYRPGLPESMRLQGTYEWFRGNRRAARRWWGRSLALAEKMGQPCDVGATHLEIGLRTGERAHLAQAEAILAEIGAAWHLARAREALKMV